MKESEQRVADAVRAAGPELAKEIGKIVHESLMRPSDEKPSPVQHAITQSVAETLHMGATMGSEIAQSRTEVRVVAAMRIVACVLMGKGERIAGIWNTANAWVEPKSKEVG